MTDNTINQETENFDIDEVKLPIKRVEGDTVEDVLTNNAYNNILPSRYLMKDENGDVVEDPSGLFERVAKNVALADIVYQSEEKSFDLRAKPSDIKPNASSNRREDLCDAVFGESVSLEDDVEIDVTEENVNAFAYETLMKKVPEDIRDTVRSTAEQFEDDMKSLSFMPNSPTLMNAGDDFQQLSACFVDSPEDDINDIHQTSKEAAKIFQCLTEDTTVETKNGRKQIIDVSEGDKILQRGDSSTQFSTVEDVFVYDDAPTTTVELKSGQKVTGTPNHDLLVNGNWRSISEIQIGDNMHIPLNYNIPNSKEPKLKSVQVGSQWESDVNVDEIIRLNSEGYSDYEIADKIESSPSTVQRWRSNRLELPKNNKTGAKKGQNIRYDEDRAEKLYNQGLSDAEIAEKLGTSDSAIRSFRIRNSLERNNVAVKEVIQPDNLTSEIAELVGLWIGDGSHHQDGIRFHIRRDSVKQRIEKLSEEQFGIKPSSNWDNGCYEICIHSHELKRWWKENFGKYKLSASEATVPDAIFDSGKIEIASFIRGLFTANGSLTKGKYPTLTTVSEDLASDVQSLLIRTGIPAKDHIDVSNNKIDSKYERHYVSVTTETGLRRYPETVGWIDEERRIKNSITVEESNFKKGQYGYVKEDCSEWVVPVESTEQKENQSVYDISVKGKSEYIANDIVSHNSGGGMGYAFTNLRPYGDRVGSTGGIASGPISFMRTFDQMCATIAQGGKRRGAQMGILRIDHPDILQFIHAKDEDVSLAHELKLNDPDDFTHNSFGEALEEARDLIIEEDGVNKVPEHLRNAAEGHLSNFNISVGVTDDFMEAVKNDEEYELINPRTGETHIATEETKELYGWFGLGDEVEVGEPLSIPAQEVYRRITKGAWENGEPGMIFLERANKMHSFDVDEHPEHEILATNPCLSGDMEVAVIGENKDSIEISKLAERDDSVLVYSLDDGEVVIKEATAFKTKQNAETITINTDGNMTLEVTPDHKIRTNNRGWVEASDLEQGDSLQILKQWVTSAIGGKDSSYKMVKSNDTFISEHRLVARDLIGENIEEKQVHHKNFDSLDNDPENLQLVTPEEHQEIHNISGENNPIFKLKKEGEFEEYKNSNPFYNTSGKNNPMFGTDRTKRETITCEECEDEFEVTPHLVEKRSFCSQKCVSNSRVETEEFDCKVCESTIITTPSIAKRRDYCSRQCSGKEFDKNLSDDGRQKLSELMQGSNNPMKNDSVSTKKVENTDYAEVAEKISESRKEKIDNGELEKVVENNGSVVCQICSDEFKSITNTHLKSKHDCTVEEYKDRYPNAKVNGGKQVKIVENHKVTSIEISGNKDVYDLNVPETHNFFAGKNVDEGSTKVYTNVHNCGEQPLEEYEACNLGHINLSTVVDEESPDWRVYDSDANTLEEQVSDFLDEAVDWDILDRRIRTGTHFLENVVTMSDFPVDEITEKVGSNRKIGLGIMGLAQMYIQLGTRYGSDVSNEIAKQVMEHINYLSKKESHNIATGEQEYAERGVFSNWHKSKYQNPTEYSEWFEKLTGLDAEDWEDGFKIRNHNTTTIAPTGTTSMIGDTTGGCEPIYNVAYYKNVSGDVQGDEMLVEFDDYFLRTLEANDIEIKPVKKEAQQQMSDNKFDGVDSLSTVPDAVGELFVTTGDLSALEHARVQCALQNGVDSAISKTVNAPNSATPEDAQDAFMEVYDGGGKGVTYYRDGTRSKQVLTTREDNQETDEEEAIDVVKDKLEKGDIQPSDLNLAEEGSQDTENPLDVDMTPMSRPKSLDGVTKEVNTGYGDLFVTVNETDDGQPFEVFANIGKSGGYTESFTEATARLISLCLRCGIDPDDVVEQIEGIRSPKVSWDNSDQIYSVPDGVAMAIERYMEDSENSDTDTNLEATKQINNPNTAESSSKQDVVESGENPECPNCSGLSLYYSEGCKTCEEYGWSEC